MMTRESRFGAGVFFLALIVGCGGGGGSSDTSPDSAVNCDAICSAELSVVLEPARADFAATVSGQGFNQLSIGCPDGVYAGGPYGLEMTCEDDGFTLLMYGMTYPEELTFTVDYGDPFTVTPDYTESEQCATFCNSAEVLLGE